MGMQATTTRLTYARNDYIKQGRSHIFDKVGDMIFYATVAQELDYFFVDGTNGDDDNDGKTFDTAKALISAAHTLCTTNKNDYIVALNTAVDGEASYPITISKNMVHVIGLVRGFNLAKEPMIGTTDSAVAMNVTGNEVEVTGFGFCAGSTSGCLTVGSVTGVFGLLVRDCSFGLTWLGAQDGIQVPQTYGAPDLEVDHCIFGPMLTSNGIRIYTNATRAHIHDNQFRRVANEAIHLGEAAAPTDVWIVDNRFALPSDTAKYAIRIDLGSGGFIDGNSANYGTTQMSNNPYYDVGSNHWGLNYKAGVSILPATS